MSATSPADAGCKAYERIVSILTLYCVTITWQQIFKGLLQVTVVANVTARSDQML